MRIRTYSALAIVVPSSSFNLPTVAMSTLCPFSHHVSKSMPLNGAGIDRHPYVLAIGGETVTRGTDRNQHATTIAKRLHIYRSHFAATESAPLFGRLTGRFWCRRMFAAKPMPALFTRTTASRRRLHDRDRCGQPALHRAPSLSDLWRPCTIAWRGREALLRLPRLRSALCPLHAGRAGRRSSVRSRGQHLRAPAARSVPVRSAARRPVAGANASHDPTQRRRPAHCCDVRLTGCIRGAAFKPSV